MLWEPQGKKDTQVESIIREGFAEEGVGYTGLLAIRGKEGNDVKRHRWGACLPCFNTTRKIQLCVAVTKNG